MKQFYMRYRKSILVQALQSGSLLSLYIYAIIRVFFYEFPLSWIGEIFFFLRTYGSSCFLLATASGGTVMFYRSVLKIKRNRTPA